VLAVGLAADRAGRLRFFRDARLLAGRGSALIISCFAVWPGQLAGHPFGFVVVVVFLVVAALRVLVILRVFVVFLDGGLLSLSRVGGLRRGGPRLAT
jgi:hypothetical protein